MLFHARDSPPAPTHGFPPSFLFSTVSSLTSSRQSSAQLPCEAALPTLKAWLQVVSVSRGAWWPHSRARSRQLHLLKTSWPSRVEKSALVGGWRENSVLADASLLGQEGAVMWGGRRGNNWVPTCCPGHSPWALAGLGLGTFLDSEPPWWAQRHTRDLHSPGCLQ